MAPEIKSSNYIKQVKIGEAVYDVYDESAHSECENISSAIQMLSGATPPTTSTVGVVGQTYYDTTGDSFYKCIAANQQSGTYTWKEHMSEIFSFGTSAPSNKKILWIDTNSATGGLKYYNGTSWVHVPVAYT